MSNRNKTAHEVADALAVARTSVHEWARSGCPFDEVSPPGTRGVVGRLFNLEEVQQWRAARVHGNTNVVRAPKSEDLPSSSRIEARARVMNIMADFDGSPTSPCIQRMFDLVESLIDTQEAIAKQALNQIATAKRAANELVANRSNRNGV